MIHPAQIIEGLFYQKPITILTQANATNTNAQVTPEILRNSYIQARLSSLVVENPLWEEFLNSLSTAKLNYDIPQNDLVVDKDPFFLRSQKWTNSGFKSKDKVYFAKQKRGFFVTSAYSSKAIYFNLDMTPIQDVDDFIIFSADKNSNIFESKIEDDNYGEGFFFISKTEMAQAEQAEVPVSVYFFPLPGNGWQGIKNSYHLTETGHLVIGNEGGFNLPIDVVDIKTVMNHQRIIKTIATVNTLMLAQPENIKNQNDLIRELNYLRPGTTAGFGITAPPIEKGAFSYNKFQKVLEWLSSSLVKKAHALDLNFDPNVITQLKIYGGLITTILVASVVLKYTVLKEKLAVINAGEKKAREEAKNAIQNDNEGNKEKRLKKFSEPGKTKQFFKDVFTVFAHGTTTVAQIGPVTLGYAIEIFGDKFLPEYAAANHKMLRKIMHFTGLWVRDNASNVAVNWKTFFLGAVVLGLVVDTPYVAWQDLVFFPWLATYLHSILPNSITNGLYHEFVTEFENNKKVLIQGVVRSGVAWMLSGASGYSAETKVQLMPKVESAVDEAMIKEGLNPKEPSLQSLRSKRVAEMYDLLSSQRGLPGKSTFLFDLKSLIQKSFHFVGYGMDYPVSADGDFILTSRPFLAKNALNKAIRVAKQRLSENNSKENKQVLELLESTLQDFSLLSLELIKSPIKKLKKMRETRRILTLLGYSGDHNLIISAWARNISPYVANMAGDLFRKSLMSYISAQENREIRILDKDVERLLPEASRLIRTEIDMLHQTENKLKMSDREFAEWISNNHIQYESLLDEKLRDLIALEERRSKEKSYTPHEDDWLAKRQKRIAAEKTLAQMQSDKSFLDEIEKSRDSSEKERIQREYQTRWKQEYSKNLAKEVGLYINNRTRVDLLERVHAQTEMLTNNEIENTIGLKNYMSKLSEFESLKFTSDLYAANFLDEYIRETAQDTEKNEADFVNWQKRMLLPDQPGRFQALRQTDVVVKSKMLTRLVRWWDSWFDEESYKPGVKNYLIRNVPFSIDMILSWNAFVKGTTARLTTSYLVLTTLFYVQWSWATFLWFSLIAPVFISVPAYWVSRFFKQQGLKPMDTIVSKIKFGIIYSPATMWATVPFIVYNKEVNDFFNGSVYPSLTMFYNSIPAEVAVAAGLATGLVLTPQVRNFVRKMITGSSDNIKRASYIDNKNLESRVESRSGLLDRLRTQFRIENKNQISAISCEHVFIQ